MQADKERGPAAGRDPAAHGECESFRAPAAANENSRQERLRGALLLRRTPGGGFELRFLAGDYDERIHLARSDDDVIADWRALASRFGLRLLAAADGPGAAVEPHAPPSPRRFGSALRHRRPRFLARRRSGRPAAPPAGLSTGG